jgi:hypothetical protein
VPTEGDFDLTGRLGALRRRGFPGRFTVEVLSDSLVGHLGVTATAQHIADRTRTLFATIAPAPTTSTRPG